MTKKFKISLVAMVCVFFSGYAQKVEFGVKAGANYSTLTDYTSETTYAPGFQVGGFMQYAFNDNLRLQTELLFSREGGKSSLDYEDEIQSIMLKEHIRFGYINLPIMLQYKIYKGLHVEVGPQLGYLVSAENEYDARYTLGEFELEESGTESIIDEMNKFSFGVNLGLQYDINDRFFVNARYSRGLTKIASNSFIESEDDEVEDNVDYAKIRNQSFSLGVGFKF